MIHPVGGHVYFYRELARELGGELPVWGLRASGLEPGEEPLGSIEEMAERYLDEVREVQPAGPYRLGGSSLGGVVAYEMARRLADRGEEVSFLALLDAPGPGHLPPKPADEAELLAQLFGEPLGLDAEELRALDPESRLELVVEAFRRSDAGVGERFGVDEARRQVRVLQAGMAALFAYEGGSYGGSVLFLRARERRPQDPAHPELAWIDRAAGVEVHVVPGDHVSMHQPPHRSVLVKRLRRALEGSRGEVVTR